MSLSTIQKIASSVAFPLSKNSNILYFDVHDEGTAYDLASSYLELEMDLNVEGGNRNVVLGRDGLMYNSSAIVRTAKLHEPITAKTYQDLVYVNVLSNNLTRYSEGVNKVASDSLWGGSGKVDSEQGNSNVYSVFNNNYSDQKPVLKVPLSYLFPGSLGESEMFHASEDLRFQFLLEPQYNFFQRAVKKNYYNNKNGTTTAETVPVNAAAGNVVTFTCTNAGDVVKIADFATVNIQYTLNAVVSVATRKVISHTADAPGVNGTFTIESSITGEAGDALTVITFNSAAQDVYLTTCNDISATTDTLTLTTPIPTETDIWKGTVCKIAYKKYTQGNLGTQFFYQTRTVKDLGVADDLINTIQFETPLNPAPVEYWTEIHIEPLYTNLSNSWTVSDAHLVVYRRAGGEKPVKGMALQTFQSVNYAILGGLDKSFYTIKSPINTYNAYALLPTNDNMISVCEDANETGSISQYRVYVDELPLTSIYIPINSALHEDNLMRVLDNSSEYKPMNLRQDRDNTVITQKKPDVVVGKLFNSVLSNKANYQNPVIPDRNLKLELTGGANGTPQKNVYCFMEMFKFIVSPKNS